MASLGVLTAGISHEMNNPLNFIAGGINMIENEIEENSIPKNTKESLENAVSMVKDGFDRSITIVKSLTKLTNKDRPVLINANISEVINNALDLLSNELVGIKLTTLYNLDYIFVYPDRLQQAVYNILENAIYSTSNKSNSVFPEIKIETQYINKENPEGRIIIFNSGERIYENNLSKVFDPFYTTKETGDGTGLGLSTAYSFVDQHGGHIEVENKESGVIFTITLPVRN